MSPDTCYSGCMPKPLPRAPEPLPSSLPPAESPDGVDLTLIHWTLSLTPRERLDLLQDWVDGLAELPAGTNRGALGASAPLGPAPIASMGCQRRPTPAALPQGRGLGLEQSPSGRHLNNLGRQPQGPGSKQPEPRRGEKWYDTLVRPVTQIWKRFRPEDTPATDSNMPSSPLHRQCSLLSTD